MTKKTNRDTVRFQCNFKVARCFASEINTIFCNFILFYTLFIYLLKKTHHSCQCQIL